MPKESVLNQVEEVVLNRELKAQEEAKKAKAGKETASDPELSNIIDDFIAQCDDPNYFRTVYDKVTGKKVVLSDEDLEVIDRIRKAVYPDPNYDPYEPYVDFFSQDVSIHPVMNRPEPKAAFIPSLSEKRALTKLVAMIRSGRLKPYKPKKRRREQFKFGYDLWRKEGETDTRRHRGYIAAPKMALPGHAESYNPPQEYLLTVEDVKKWENQTEEEREQFYLPQRFPNLRSVPLYTNTLRERFERCLELYMCPRQRIRRAKVDPESLIPKLPKPKDLQPFPSVQSLIYKGHSDVVHSISVEPQGQFMVSGSEDGTVKFWEILSGRCWRTINLGVPVRIVAWCPKSSVSVVAIVTTNQVYFVNSQVGDSEIIEDTETILKQSGDVHNKNKLEQEKRTQTSDGESEPDSDDAQQMPARVPKRIQPLKWEMIDDSDEMYQDGIRFRITSLKTIDQFVWHPNGDYFSVVMPDARSLSVVIGHWGLHKSSYPFKKTKLHYQRVAFHPRSSKLYAADDRTVVIYDLSKKEIIKKLTTGLKTTSSMAVHPKGDNLIVGSYDPRIVWFDTDLSTKPYKIMRYHKQAIRNVCYHKKYPLFASASDDGHVIVSHGMVYDDMTENALIVPLKMLHGHEHTNTLAVTDCKFHYGLPWIFSSGSDKTIRLFSH